MITFMKRLLPICAALVLAFPTCPAFAAGASNDDLAVTIKTNSDTYEQGDAADINCVVKNLTAESISGTATLHLPSEMSLIDGTEFSTDLGNIKAGETKEVTFYATVDSDKDRTKNEAVNATDASSTKAKTVNTSDRNLQCIIAALAIIAFLAILALAIFRGGRKSKGTLAILLAFVLVGCSTPLHPSSTANADELKSGTVSATTAIKLLGKTDNVSVDVAYRQTGATSGATHNVTFFFQTKEMIDNIEQYATMQVADGALLQQPNNPTSKALTFHGWYTDFSYENEYDFSTPVNSDLVLIAKTSVIPGDSDGDGMEDGIENWYGTDPYNPDTDGDGLPDGVEIKIGTNPLVVDTDGNGVNDYDEDFDSDGLSNGREVELGCDPANADTDGDDLNDGIEVDTYGTNPLNPDTDGDGAEDGWELFYEFDPLIANPTFDVRVEAGTCSADDPVTAAVEINGLDGSQLETLSVDKVTSVDNELVNPAIPGYMGFAYEFSVEGAFAEATISFQYDQSTFGEPSETFQPRIYYVNEATGFLEKLDGQTLEGDIVTARTAHFSTYILLNEIPFNKAWESDIKKPVGGDEGKGYIDVVFAMDYSASMDWNDPYFLRKDVTKSFIEKLRDGCDRAALVSFARNAYTDCELTTDKSQVLEAVDLISNNSGEWFDPDAGTNGTTALRAALDEFEQSSASSKFIVFMTDGEDTHSDPEWTYQMLEAEAAENGIRIFTVGLGSANESLLEEIAEATGGGYYFARAGLDLDDIYSQIEGETVDLVTDTNSDGIPDYYSELIKNGTLLLSNGSRQFAGIDFNYDKDGNLSADYDGDGVPNGEELVLHINESTGGVYLEMKSNPVISSFDFGDSETRMARAGYDKDSVDWLLTDRHFYYENEVREANNEWIKGADPVLSRLFGVCPTSVFSGEIIDFVDERSNKYSVYEEEAQRYDAQCIIQEAIGALTSELANTVDEDKERADKIVSALSYGNTILEKAASRKVIYASLEVELSAFMTRVNAITPDYRFHAIVRGMSLNAQMTIVTASRDTTSNKLLGNALNTMSCAFIAYDAINSLRKTAAVSGAYQRLSDSFEVLDDLKLNASNNDVKNAAADVKNAIAGNCGDLMGEIILDSAIQVGLVLLEEIATKNLVGTAIVIFKETIKYVFGLDEDYENKFKLYTISDLTETYCKFFTNNVHINANQYIANEDNCAAPYSALVNVGQCRMIGNRHAYDFCKINGLQGILSGDSSNADLKAYVENEILLTQDFERKASGCYIEIDSDIRLE